MQATLETPTIDQRSKYLVPLELIGAVVMILLGSAMHFAFEWLGRWTPLALFAAVNESIWEHLKLAFWPGLFWGCIMPLPPHQHRLDILSAKGVSLAVTAALIVSIFSTYTTILGRNLLILDIGTFVVAICVGQMLSALLLLNKTHQRWVIFLVGTALMALQVVAYSLFTFFPPEHWLFIETKTGIRGIASVD